MASSPAYDPSTFPSAATYPAPAYAPYTFHSTVPYEHPFSSPIPTQIDPNWPLSAHPPIHGEPHLTSYLFPHLQAQPSPQSYCFPTPSCYKNSPATFSTYTAPKPGVFSAAAYAFPSSSPVPYHNFYSTPYAYPYTTSSLAAPPVPTQEHLRPSQCTPSDTPTAPNREHWPPQPPTTIPTRPASTARSAGSPESHAVLELQTHEVQPLPPDSIRQGDALTKGNRTSCETIYNWQSPDEKFVCKHELLNIHDHLDQQQACEQTLAYVAPQVTDKMPPPQFGCENYCTGHPNSIQSSCVQGGSTNISEQNLHGRPQQYGFHDLNQQSVFRADGSDHSYFALPDDYPLELASLEPVFDVYDDDTDGCSTEFVDVPSGTPKQQSHEEEQQDSEQLPKCVRQVPEVEQTTTLNYISDVIGFNHELQQQDDEKASVNVQQLRDPPLKVLVTHEGRKEWDPGIHTIVRSTLTRDIVGFLQTSILPRSVIFVPNGVLAVRIQFVEPKSWVLRQCYGRTPSRLINQGIQLLWDPGILNKTDMMLVLLASESTKNRFADQKLMANSKVAALTWHSSITGTSFLLLNSTNYTWDPGVMKFIDTMLDKWSVTHQVQSVQHATKLSFFCSDACIQYYASNGVYSVLHVASLVLHKARHYLCSLHYQTKLCQIRCLWEFSISSTKRVQWDPGILFVYQQGIQKNYNAKNLLSSDNYLQICKMDIIFITFLPP